jgi:hypothetical protein
MISACPLELANPSSAVRSGQQPRTAEDLGIVDDERVEIRAGQRHRRGELNRADRMSCTDVDHMRVAEPPIADPSLAPDRSTSDLGWLVIIATAAGIGAFLFLARIQDENTLSGNHGLTETYARCLGRQTTAYIRAGERLNPEDCAPLMPWYAAQPGWSALTLSVAVLVTGYVASVIRRTEPRRLP